MAFLFVRLNSSCWPVGVGLALALIVALPVADTAAQTKAARSAQGAPAEVAATAPDNAQDANSPAGSAARSGETMPPKGAESPQDRDRRLMLLRLLVQGGGSYRPFGFFR